MTGLDADGLPLFPPLPAGHGGQRPGARTIARLVAGVRTAVLTVQTEETAAMVVFVEHEPVDGVAVRGDRRVTGPDALDEIADAPVELVTVTGVTPELARAVGAYFLPTELRGVPAGLVVPEDFVRSLARPGQRGCLLVRADEGLGVVFMARGGVVLAYRQDGPTGGLEQVAPLFASPGATLWARLGPDTTAAETEAAAEPVAPPAPEPEPVPVPEPPPPPVFAPAPPPPPPPGPVMAEPDELLEVALAEAREVLGPHVVRVEAVLRRAEPTADGLRAAAESLHGRRVRLLGQATMDLLADRLLAALGHAARPG